MDPLPEATRDAPPVNWREAVLDLLSARIELFRLEAKSASAEGARKAIALAVMAIASTFTWALVLAGAIPLLAETTGVRWPFIALGAAGVHLIVAILMLARLRRSGPAAFPITRNEFQRDREWFRTLKPPQ